MRAKLLWVQLHDLPGPFAAMAIRMSDNTSKNRKEILEFAGYETERVQTILVNISSPDEYQRDPEGWKRPSMRDAHRFISKHWDVLDDGNTVNIE